MFSFLKDSVVVEDVTCRPGSFHHCVVWSLVVSCGLVVVVENPGDCGVVSMSCVASPFLWSVVGVVGPTTDAMRERCNDSRASRVLVVLLLSRCVCVVYLGFLFSLSLQFRISGTNSSFLAVSGSAIVVLEGDAPVSVRGGGYMVKKALSFK